MLFECLTIALLGEVHCYLACIIVNTPKSSDSLSFTLLALYQRLLPFSGPLVANSSRIR